MSGRPEGPDLQLAGTLRIHPQVLGPATCSPRGSVCAIRLRQRRMCEGGTEGEEQAVLHFAFPLVCLYVRNVRGKPASLARRRAAAIGPARSRTRPHWLR
jgi:hypothetical protein